MGSESAKPSVGTPLPDEPYWRPPREATLWYILEEVSEDVNLVVAIGPWRLHNLGQASTSEETAHARK